MEKDKLNFTGLMYCAELFSKGVASATSRYWSIKRCNDGDLVFEISYLPNKNPSEKQAVMGYFLDKGFDDYSGNMEETQLARLIHVVCMKMPNLIEKCINRDDIIKKSALVWSR